MNILHISAHLGDGAGKAITGLSASDGINKYACYLLDEPRKMKWVDFALENGIEVFWNDAEKLSNMLSVFDVVVFNWWECKITLEFLSVWETLIAKRKIIWTHQNGLFPPFPAGLIESADKFLATTPLTIKKYPNIGTLEDNLVYGFGNFHIENFTPKNSYKISETLEIVYVGMSSYKRFPANIFDFFKAIIGRIPNVKFTLFGDYSDDFRNDVLSSEIANFFDLRGWVNDVIARIKEYDIGLYIIKDEISSTTENSVIEALSCALPIVISKIEPYEYLLEDGISGFLAKTPDE
ncbi:MAG: glycosyltransferase, partial [Oscillospiraceae bacterium]|nr:glycosyltransferase [Oscillospiraceae bacterium]